MPGSSEAAGWSRQTQQKVRTNTWDIMLYIHAHTPTWTETWTHTHPLFNKKELSSEATHMNLENMTKVEALAAALPTKGQ